MLENSLFSCYVSAGKETIKELSNTQEGSFNLKKTTKIQLVYREIPNRIITFKFPRCSH